jgi:dihydropteroate synthase
MLTMNCNGKILNLNTPIVMGIINITPDSFYEGHLDKNESELLLMAEKMIKNGASILDIGGQSTKPGSKRIEADEELKRVITIIKSIRKNFATTIYLYRRFMRSSSQMSNYYWLLSKITLLRQINSYYERRR